MLHTAGTGRLTAQISLAAIEQNVRQLDSVSGSARVMAVVKGNGYGHGLLPSAMAAIRGGASWLGVARLEEGQSLRAAGLHQPILLLLCSPADSFVEAARQRLDLPIGLSGRSVRHATPHDLSTAQSAFTSSLIQGWAVVGSVRMSGRGSYVPRAKPRHGIWLKLSDCFPTLRPPRTTNVS